MKVYCIGGYNEVGKNMTAVEVDNEIVIFDMGYNMEKVVEYGEEIDGLGLSEIMDIGAIPNDKILLKSRKKVKAIVLNHGHLDHCGAIPKLANAYNCPIIAPPYACDIIRKLLKDSKTKIRNKIIELPAGKTISISPKMELEFVHITHSIPDTVVSVLNTVEGKIVYANDFKLDEEPTLGKKPDYKRLKEIGSEKVKLLITDTTRIFERNFSSSEKEAQIKLKHTFSRIYPNNSLVVVTSFSSHIARINNILRANNGERNVVMLGRSLKEYATLAEKRGFIDLTGIKLARKRKDISELLKKISKNRGDYLVICTGNQGEPNAILPRLAKGLFPFQFEKRDHVVFSCHIIPSPINISNRYILEKKLREKGVEIYRDVHVTGHAHREDHRKLIKLLNPENIVPSHGETERLASYASLAIEEGYELEKSVHISQNGRILRL